MLSKLVPIRRALDEDETTRAHLATGASTPTPVLTVPATVTLALATGPALADATGGETTAAPLSEARDTAPTQVVQSQTVEEGTKAVVVTALAPGPSTGPRVVVARDATPDLDAPRPEAPTRPLPVPADAPTVADSEVFFRRESKTPS